MLCLFAKDELACLAESDLASFNGDNSESWEDKDFFENNGKSLIIFYLAIFMFF